MGGTVRADHGADRAEALAGQGGPTRNHAVEAVVLLSASFSLSWVEGGRGEHRILA